MAWSGKNPAVVANYLQLLVLLGGVGGFLWQYYVNSSAERRQEIRAERTRMFTFLARYYEPPIASARLSVERFLSDPELNKFLDEKGTDKSNIIMKSVQNAGIVPNLVQLVDYFNSVEVCIEAEACDLTLGCSQLKEDAHGLMDTFAPVFQKLKEEWGSDPFEKIKKLVIRCENSTG